MKKHLIDILYSFRILLRFFLFMIYGGILFDIFCFSTFLYHSLNIYGSNLISELFGNAIRHNYIVIHKSYICKKNELQKLKTKVANKIK